jgi:hypothetical protein
MYNKKKPSRIHQKNLQKEEKKDEHQLIRSLEQFLVQVNYQTQRLLFTYSHATLLKHASIFNSNGN